MKRNLITLFSALIVIVSGIFFLSNCQNNTNLTYTIKGNVQKFSKGNFTIEAYKYGKDTTLSIGEVLTDSSGNFTITLEDSLKNNDVILLEAASKNNPFVTYSTVINKKDAKKAITVNALTTVTTSAVFAQFIENGKLAGKHKLLVLASDNMENFVNKNTGSWGKIILNGDNLTESTTMGRINTLANILVAVDNGKISSTTIKNTFLTKNENATNTVDALAKMFKHSWFQKEQIFKLFTSVYPRINDDLREVAFVPYLEQTPNDFALMLEFNGGGVYAPGKLVVDKDNNIWSGQNWMPGSQSNTLRGIGGGLVKLASNGKALSPAVTGFVGPNINGVGWGTYADSSKVWLSSFTGGVSAFDFNGKPIKTEIHGKVGNLHGIYSSPVTHDVWICDATMNQMIVFRGGNPLKGEVVKVPGLMSPFSVVVDSKNNVWVGNSAGYYVTMFNGNTPSKTTTYSTEGISVRGLVIDNNDQVWANNTFNLDTKVPQVDPTMTIMEQFTFLGRFSSEKWPYATKKTVGSVVLLNKNNPTKPALVIPSKGNQICGPWGVSVDGANTLWDANFLSGSVLSIATKDNVMLGIKKGELIHNFKSGIIQCVTDVVVDHVGNVWVANNWDNEPSVVGLNNGERNSTKGGGKGITVIYGVAKPLK
ncbi:NHL repeat-containing protein [Flammeovirga kamogawensis]|uniref:Uncharacterized protein n=1 Tax=Flammeovirga kamogawensis TaxID=373891 RepID=A0ABX8GQ02_9BACT|nr:hypothetical protein [Flammeovirga kamogawensis]MBB6463468.1 hypothetical protein [Flammeovirga kamogawensis]QWG05606.1 hypothetical protein KM029_09440 [Flammeovirga kamogawensis]TRX67438.1 hypothetical protein EO216_04480 [Flammeovirga kamogawensis]